MSTDPRIRQWKTRMASDGRLAIPVEVRRALDLDEDDELLLTVEHGRLVLETERGLLERLYEAVGPAPAGGWVSDALIRERRDEAASESAETDS